MYGKKALKVKLLYVGLTKMCVGRFLFFISQMLNRITNVVLAYNCSVCEHIRIHTQINLLYYLVVSFFCLCLQCQKQTQMKKFTMKPIYGTTMSGTETIFDKWVNGDKERAIKLLVMYINVNKPETPNNTEQMAKDAIEKWIDDNF